MRAVILLSVLVLACGNPQRHSPRAATLEGTVNLPQGGRGDAYVFLYRPGEGPPLSLASPVTVTGVSDARITDSVAPFLFEGLEPNPYRVFAFGDLNLNFNGDVDVLAQPGAGDVQSDGVEVNLEPGAKTTLPLIAATRVPLEPPAFHVEGIGESGVATIVDTPNVVNLSIVADGVGVLDDRAVGFSVSLVDRDGDGRPDDGNGDGVPDAYPQTFLRWLPKPGQVVPVDAHGNPEDVLLPLAFNPGPFLTLLNGDPKAAVIVERLDLFLLPQAEVVENVPGQPPRLVVQPAIPPGSYELLVIQKSGQFWKVPNGLGATTPSQALQFQVTRSSQ